MNEPITHPNRLTRRRKKRWKIADLIKSGLTDCYRVAILCLSINRSTGLAISEIHGAYRHQRGFFMRKISALHITSGWVGIRKGGRVVCPVLQPTQFGTMVAIVMPGLEPFTHGTQS